MKKRRLLSLLVVSCLFQATAYAADWTLTTADFKSRPVDLVGMTSEAVTVRKGEGAAPETVPVSNFLQVSHGVVGSGPTKAGAAAFTLALASGDRITGTPAALGGETLTWSSPAVGELKVSLRDVESLSKSSVTVPAVEQPPAEDTVTLGNGDVVKGIVSGLADGKLNVSQGGETVEVPLDSVRKLVFASPGKTAAAGAPARGFRLRLGDGSTLTVAGVTVAEDKATVKMAGDDKPRTLPLASVQSIEQVNGPVTFLSSLTPAKDVQRPYLGDVWPTKFDRTVTGQPIRIAGQGDVRGIGVHAYSKVTFAIGEGYQAFRTQYALDGGGPLANVTVRVLLDGKVAYEQKNVTSTTPSKVVNVPIKGEKTLALEVDYGLSNDTQDRFVWVEPALLRQGN